MKIFKNKLFMSLMGVVSVIVLALGITFACIDLTPALAEPNIVVNIYTQNNKGEYVLDATGGTVTYAVGGGSSYTATCSNPTTTIDLSVSSAYMRVFTLTANAATGYVLDTSKSNIPYNFSYSGTAAQAATYNAYFCRSVPINSGNWTDSGNYDIDWKGEGTEESPYLIETERQLAGLASLVNRYSQYSSAPSGVSQKYYNNCITAYYKLMNDLNLMDYYWMSIGNGYYESGYQKNFDGKFDGNGKLISNIFVSVPAASYVSYCIGVFGDLKSNAVIKNLGVNNVRTAASSSGCYAYFTGAIAGRCSGEIKDCYSDGIINVSHFVSSGNKAGGIVGILSGKVYNCYTKANIIDSSVSSGYYSLGGIAGDTNSNATIANCFVIGSITGNSNDTIGNISSTTTDVNISNCYYGGDCSVSTGGGIQITDLSSTVKSKSWYARTSVTNSATTWSATYPWDFDNVWNINSNKNDGYPYFKFQYNFVGEGTSANSPYQISTEEDLRALATMANEGNNFSGKYFKQTANIRLGKEQWISIGSSSSSAFVGTYDGDGFIIYGLKGIGGLFGYASSATLTNIHLRDSYISSGATVGSIANSVNTISNCSSDALIEVSMSSGSAGGIAGSAANVDNCSFSGQIIGVSQNVGGIVGGVSGTSGINITNCVNTGSIIAKYNDSTCPYSVSIGGILGGTSSYQITIRNCISKGNISANVVVTGTNGCRVGSMIGWLNNYMNTIENCAGYGVIQVLNTNAVGGLIGSYSCASSGGVKNCSFVGSSNVENLLLIGNGISNKISSCYIQVDDEKYYIGTDFSGFTVVANMNEDLPMQNEIYSVAIGGQTSEYIIESLEGKGFKPYTA